MHYMLEYVQTEFIQCLWEQDSYSVCDTLMCLNNLAYEQCQEHFLRRNEHTTFRTSEQPSISHASLRTVLESIKHLEQQVIRTVRQDQLSKVFATAVLRSIEQGVCNSSLEISWARCLQQQSQDQSSKVFANSKVSFYKVSRWSNKSLGLYWFYF